MKERLVMLCKLGQGASSIVFKALDLTELRLVAIKMVPVYERDKRRQMVRELSALFQVLRKKQIINDYNESCMYISLLFDLKNNKYNSKSSKLLSNNDSIIQSRDQKTFKICPQEYIVDFYDAFSNIEEGGVALMMEYMDGGSLQVFLYKYFYIIFDYLFLLIGYC
jgi:serine/threonine protein kinase